VAFDIESTGVDVETARIVTAAIAVVGGGEPTEEWTCLINPGCEIPDEAAAVHGITTEIARRDGTAAPAAIAAIARELDRREPGCALVVFNAPFDLTILDRELRRHGHGDGTRFAQNVIDPYVVDKHLDRFRRGSRKLDAMCAHYQATLDGAHDAAHDAVAAARIAWCIGQRGRVVRRVRNRRDAIEADALGKQWERVRGDLPALHEAERCWARDQARGLAEYFAAKGDAQHVAEDWPLIPAGARAAA
jgi:DNA polymerase-3 subunit epsilon